MFFLKKKNYYFDSGSFTPICSEALKGIQSVLYKQSRVTHGNPIALHGPGRRAQKYLDEAQGRIASVCRVKKKDVIFTSGATEANHIAIRTALLHATRQGMKLSDIHVIINHEEHSSIHKDIKYFKTFGVQSTIIVPKIGALLTAQDVIPHIRKNTIYLSIQYVNSNHGIIQPLASIARACRSIQPSLFIHTDAAQGSAYFFCSPHALGVDAVTIDSTKTFGPQGVGALLFRKIENYSGLDGECESRDFRPGTPSVPLYHGFGIAFENTHKKRKTLYRSSYKIRNYLITMLKEHIQSPIYVYGMEKQLQEITPKDLDIIAPHLLYLSFSGVNHAYLAALLDSCGFSVSTGAACSKQVDDSLRIGVLPTTSRRDVRALVRCIRKQLPLAHSTVPLKEI